MNKETYKTIESYMLEMMGDKAHDYLHIYRVLSVAWTIAKTHDYVNMDILIASCLLHDIGRGAQLKDPTVCHAVEGGKLAYGFLKKTGFGEDECLHVKDCITTHRFRSDNPPKTIEAKILFDADKLDVTGAIGIARTLIYSGQTDRPLYTADENLNINDGKELSSPDSFFREYHFKLSKLYDRFYTEEGRKMAEKRREITLAFYEELKREVAIENINELLELQ